MANPFHSRKFYIGLIGVVASVVGYFAPTLIPYFDINGPVTLAFLSILSMAIPIFSKGKSQLGE